MILLLLRISLLLLTLIVGAGLAYLYFLLVVGRAGTRQKPDSKSPTTHLRFAVAIPAHNEEGAIGATVAQLRRMDYPADRFDVHVVADHCTDETATEAARAGAEAHSRNDGPRGRKGYAVDWLIRRLLADARRYDAIAVFDADSQVDPAFLREVNRYLATGAQVVQGRHVIINPHSSCFAALADADMRLNNLIRNQAKENLGLSARLMGDAMAFRREVLEQHPWIGADSLTEDRDFGIYLVTQGIRIRFAPNAISRGQAVARWRDATPQRLRWYGGALELRKRYVKPLATLIWRQRNLDALDKLLELTFPPFSLLALGSALLAMVQGGLVLLGAQPLPWFLVSLGLMVLAALFPFVGLLATGAPQETYCALLLGPLYVIWRAGIALRVRLRPRSVTWVRTKRLES